MKHLPLVALLTLCTTMGCAHSDAQHLSDPVEAIALVVLIVGLTLALLALSAAIAWAVMFHD